MDEIGKKRKKEKESKGKKMDKKGIKILIQYLILENFERKKNIEMKKKS